MVERRHSQAAGADIAHLSIAELREARMRARRSLEVAQLRARHAIGTPIVDLEADRVVVGALTEELIRRYAADLTLVDSLLGPSYPRDGGDARREGERT